MNLKISATIVIIAIIFLCALIYFRAGIPNSIWSSPCSQEKMLCPDGKTYVSRSGLNCEFAECPVGEEYKTIALADVVNYASAKSKIIVSGTVVFVEIDNKTHAPEMVLTDKAGHYVMVAVPHVSWDILAPIISKIKIGDSVEVRGTAGETPGTLVTTSHGTKIEIIGVNLGHAPLFGVISPVYLEDIKKIDSTSTWKTYRNEKYGFEFSYDNLNFDFYDETNQAGQLSVFFQDRNSKKDERYFGTIYIKEGTEEGGEFGPGLLDDLTVEATTLGGQPAIRKTIVVQRAGYDQVEVTKTAVYQKERSIGVWLQMLNDEKHRQKYFPLYNQILSTFKFIK